MNKIYCEKCSGDKYIYVLNQKTIDILEESAKGIGVQSYTSLEDLYKDLGI